MQGNGMASDQQLRLPLEATPEDEPVAGNRGTPIQSSISPLMARVLERENLVRALKQVKRNRGTPGIDGMTVEVLPAYLKKHWPALRDELLTGQYRPQPVRRVEIPKPDGRKRRLGIPTVLDRFIQQAIALCATSTNGYGDGCAAISGSNGEEPATGNCAGAGSVSARRGTPASRRMARGVSAGRQL